jgi:hypothetical protein
VDLEATTGAAIAYLHLNLDDFNDLSPLEFDEAMKAYVTKVNTQQENHFKTIFEATRYLTVQIWNSAGKSLKHPIKNTKEAFPFPWEKPEKKVQTVDEMKEALKGIVQAFSGKKRR